VHFICASRIPGDLLVPLGVWADRCYRIKVARPAANDSVVVGHVQQHVNMSAREESLRLNPTQQQLQQQHLTVGRETSVRRGGSRRSSWNNPDDFDRRSTSSLRVDVDGVDGHSRTHSIGKKPSGQSLKSSWRLKYQDFIPDKSLTLKSEPFQ